MELIDVCDTAAARGERRTGGSRAASDQAMSGFLDDSA